MPKDKPQADRLTEAHALELGSELIRTAGQPRRSRFEVEAGGWRVVVEVCPASELPGDLTPCEADIVALLRDQPGRLTTSEILEELARLERAGKVEAHGESTVRHALARLSRRDVGVLSSRRAAPQGYAVCDRYRVQDAAEAG